MCGRMRNNYIVMRITITNEIINHIVIMSADWRIAIDLILSRILFTQRGHGHRGRYLRVTIMTALIIIQFL